MFIIRHNDSPDKQLAQYSIRLSLIKKLWSNWLIQKCCDFIEMWSENTFTWSFRILWSFLGLSLSWFWSSRASPSDLESPRENEPVLVEPEIVMQNCFKSFNINFYFFYFLASVILVIFGCVYVIASIAYIHLVLCLGSNPRPLDHEPSALSTRPWP